MDLGEPDRGAHGGASAAREEDDIDNYERLEMQRKKTLAPPQVGLISAGGIPAPSIGDGKEERKDAAAST